MLVQLPKITDPDVLIGHANADDAGVYRISKDMAVVLTADFFTPIVDDPYWFGAIAAANALSDVYAMGGKPVTALNIAMFPDKTEFFPFLEKIIQGGVDKMTEAGVSIIGGHTLRDKEPKFGYSVMGFVHPDKILDNAKAKAGDAMILTKKIGTGIIATGIKAGKCSDAVINEVTAAMAALNKRAGEIMLDVGVSTATDISGFGLIGHLHEVLRASKCQARLHSSRVPFFEDAIRLTDMGIIPGGTRDNQKSFEQNVTWDKEVSEVERILMNDAQTSGGLLIFAPQEKKDCLVDALQKEGILAAYIGDVVGEAEEDKKRIIVNK
ncbi:MAG: selenide, water dikinase SelD [Nitrospirae bacterium]|nr:selenide, water dikinase SelD [Nitrospirota bacterium]